MSATLVRDHNADTLGLADAAAVSSWSDDAGSGIALVQATGANQPLYYSGSHANAINGHAVIRFDGVNDTLATASGSISQPITMFFVVRILNQDGVNYLCGGNQLVYSQSSRWRVFNSSPSGGHVTTGVHLVEVVLNGTSTIMFVDGQEHLNAPTGVGAGALTTFAVAANAATSPALWSNLDAARIKYFTGMSQAERETERASLISTYGIASLASHGTVARTELSGTSGVTSQAWRIVVPRGYSNSAPKPLAIFHVGGSETAASIVSTSLLPRPIDALLARGFIVACSDMHSWTQWSNDTQQADIDDLIAIVAAQGYTTSGYVVSGDSRGGQSALNTLRRKSARVFLGIEPICDLAYAYGSAFTGEINTAYGITGTPPNTYALLTAGRDPNLFASSVWAGTYLRFYSSPSDTSALKTSNADHIVADATLAAEASIFPSTGAHGDPSMYQYLDAWQFLGRSIVGSISGPSSGTVSVASSAFTYTITGTTANGTDTITLSVGNGTITATAAGGAISGNGTGTVVVTLVAGATTFTFTYTPASAGSKTLTYTNGQGWTDPGASSYTAAAASSTVAPQGLLMGLGLGI